MAVLAERADDAACGVAAEVLVGSPRVEAELRSLADRCEVLTFDHEQVDLHLLDVLAAEGVKVRPGVSALTMAVDKGHMRATLAQAGLPVPEYVVIDPGPRAIDELDAFASDHGWPVMLKTTRGGYDGKGVWQLDSRTEARDLRIDVMEVPLLVEERISFDAELAVMVARSPSGESVAWPAVETAQVGGVCREVLVPGRLDPNVLAEASLLGRQVADLAGAVGVMAVELFLSQDGKLLVNEVATRPHNSGHWTIEGAATSQFENHLRAVLDLPLGSTSPQFAQVASVNIFGGDNGQDPGSLLARGLVEEGAHIHLYGKEARPGRKLGHVTVCGDQPDVVRERAWAAALALGTPRPAGLRLPNGAGT